MTAASRHFSATPGLHRGRLGRLSRLGGFVLWGTTLVATPFYVLVAVTAGAGLSLLDHARRRVVRWRGAARSLARGGEALNGALSRIISTADGTLRPLLRRRADQWVISLSRARAFSNDTSTPSVGARRLLERLAIALETGAWRIDVIGYDDGPRSAADVDERAGPASLRLSARRATHRTRRLFCPSESSRRGSKS